MNVDVEVDLPSVDVPSIYLRHGLLSLAQSVSLTMSVFPVLTLSPLSVGSLLSSMVAMDEHLLYAGSLVHRAVREQR